MQTIINKIQELAHTFNTLSPIKPERQSKLDKKFRLEFNYNSNHMEGNTLTYGETELLLIFDRTVGNHDLREYQEMQAHDVALQLIKEWATDKESPLNETKIKNLNEIILVKPFWKDAITGDGQQTRRLIKVGDYKEFPNSVRLSNEEIFQYASVTDTPIMMGELINWYRNEEEKRDLHPVELSALMHYKLVCIHPFDDGNGRIARLLMNYVLLKNDLPWVIIKSADKRNYITALNKADTGDINAFVEYIAKQLVWSLELSIKAAKGENIDEPDDIDKEIEMLAKETNIISGKNTKNSKSLSNIWDNSLLFLIQEYINKYSRFEKLFNKKDIKIGYQDTDIHATTQEYLNNLFHPTNVEKENITRIFVFYDFVDMKNMHINLKSNLTIDFHSTFFSVVIDSKQIEKKYNQILSTVEIENLINDRAELFLRGIKAEVNKANSQENES